MPTIRIRQTKPLAMLVTVMAFTTGLIACSKSDDTAKLIAEAQAYQKKGDNKSAVIQLKNALQINPDDAQARYLLGKIHLQDGDALSAEKEIRKAVSLGMDAARVMPELARSLLMQGQFQKVLDETKQGEPASGSAEISSLRGNAYLALGKNEEAQVSFDQALKNQADYADALIGLAKLALTKKDVTEAMRLAEQAVAKNPRDADAWTFKGDLLRAKGNATEALAAYDEVLKIKPANSSAYLAKAHVEIGMGKFVEAKVNVDAARKSAPNNLMVFYTQALLDFSQKKYAVALESLQQVLRVAPDHMPSILLAGAVQDALGSTQQAEQHLKKYVERNAGHLYARKLLASTLLKNGQPERAIATLAPALQTDSRDAQLYMLAGESYMQTRDFTKATQYFEKASVIAPDTAQVHTALGRSKLGQGESELAIAELEKAASLDAKSSQAGVLLVMTHLRRKEYDKALKAVQKLETEQPNNPLVHSLKGGVYLAKKELGKARESFEKAVAAQPTYFAAIQNLAQLDVQENKPDLAQKRFKVLLEKDPKNMQAMVALANLALAQGKNEEGQGWLERAASEHPQEGLPVKLLVAHFVRMGDKQKALSLATSSRNANPANPQFLEALAGAQQANGDMAATLQTYNDLAIVQPESAPVHYRIAALNMAMKNDAAASVGFKKALKLQPNFVAAQLGLAGIEVKNGNYAAALAIADLLKKEHAELSTGHVLEGDILMAQKKPAPALKAYENAYAIEKSGLLALRMHSALLQQGKDKDADTRLSQWLKDNPADNRVRMYLANHNLLNRQNKAAIEQLQKIIQAEPQNIIAINNLAWAMSQEKDVRAIGYAEQAFKLGPDNPAVLDTFGLILVEQGDTVRGLPMLKKAAALAPNALDIRFNLAKGLIKAGDKAEARKELERLLAADAKDFSKTDEARALLKQL